MLIVAAVAGAFAQDLEDPADAARFRLGPLRFTPSLAVTNLGVDGNVFNEVENPKRDTTAAVGPAVNLWMNLGRSRLTGKVAAQYLYFKDFENQRSWNTDNELRWEAPLARLTPFVSGSYANTRERAGYEIDSRARRRDSAVALGGELRLSGKSSVVVTARRSRVEFDRDEVFFGVDLARALDHQEDITGLQLRHRLTPLTTFIASTEGLRDRFTHDPIRNANSYRVLSGVELKPFALVSGKASVGYRRLDALDRIVPDYQGLVAAVDASYVRSAARLSVKVDRDLAYSFEATHPYYALMDFGVSVTERLGRQWDVTGRGSWQTLDYRQVTSAEERARRIDKARSYGAGLGYRLGDTLRLGVDVHHDRRRSSQASQREYQAFRLGASISYGLPQ